MYNIEVNSLTEYVDSICKLNEQKYALINEVFLYRGQSDKAKELIPYLGRENKYGKQLVLQERNFIELAKLKMPDVFRHDYLPLELLALLQHYGIPTRLMDVTENALVALYFACSSERNMDKDGEVFVFQNLEEDVASYPIHQAIADSSRLVRGDNYSLEFFYIGATNQPYFSEQKIVYDLVLKNQVENPVMTMEGIVSEVCSNPIFVYAPVRTLRQRTQHGRYILFPNKIKTIGNEKVFVREIAPIEKNHKCIKAIITVPSKAKQDILKGLNIMGVNKELLFCDNVDMMCEEIKNYLYSKQ